MDDLTRQKLRHLLVDYGLGLPESYKGSKNLKDAKALMTLWEDEIIDKMYTVIIKERT